MTTQTKLSKTDMVNTLTGLKLASAAQFLRLVKDSGRCIDCGESYDDCTCPGELASDVRIEETVGDIPDGMSP